MLIYNPPLRDQRFVVHELLDAVSALSAMPRYAAIDVQLVDQVLEEAGKFCAEQLLPLNQTGDALGCVYDAQTRSVKTPEGFRQAYEVYREAGWMGMVADEVYGGQQLPHLLHVALYEMQYSTNQSWAMYPGLTYGAYECLHFNGSAAQKALYLPKLACGQWMGTMCLTEPHCGTDLGLLRTKAVPLDGQRFVLSGHKIFISSGEHDLAENIVHLVLARLPDAPAGSRGISLFVVPKFLPDGEGASARVGARNGIACAGIEHKMGIHGNATCQMVLDGAVGCLVGEPHKGLAAMFVMMNSARLGVGMQGLGITEAAYQNAAAYAKERVQGRAPSGSQSPDQPADAIIHHPEIRKLLMTARAYAEGGRAVGYWVGLQADRSLYGDTPEVRQEAADMMALMTPVVKAFMTDNGFRCASDGLQVLGGHGYMRDWGMEQLVRDARINMIYEGTNGIQALDLLGRKVLMDQGAKLKQFGQMVAAFAHSASADPQMQPFVTPLLALTGELTELTMELGAKVAQDPQELGAAAVDYLRVVGHWVYAYFWARMAQLALKAIDAGSRDGFYRAKLATARFYFQRLLPETAYHMRAARAGAPGLMALDAQAF